MLPPNTWPASWHPRYGPVFTQTYCPVHKCTRTCFAHSEARVRAAHNPGLGTSTSIVCRPLPCVNKDTNQQTVIGTYIIAGKPHTKSFQATPPYSLLRQLLTAPSWPPSDQGNLAPFPEVLLWVVCSQLLRSWGKSNFRCSPSVPGGGV